MLPELTHEELAGCLDEVAAEVLAEAGVTSPPVDALSVAAALGIAVATDDRQQGRARYVRLRPRRGIRPQAAILLRSDPRHERRQWAVAHEIGEHTAHRVFARLGADPRETMGDARERIANSLAGRLLLPIRWFFVAPRRYDWDLLELKSRYATASHELIARRMLDAPPPVAVTIIDHGQVTFRRSNLPGRVPPLSSTERRLWESVHQQNRPNDARDGLLTIHGWPVHEPDWKREILRTELPEPLWD